MCSCTAKPSRHRPYMARVTGTPTMRRLVSVPSEDVLREPKQSKVLAYTLGFAVSFINTTLVNDLSSSGMPLSSGGRGGESAKSISMSSFLHKPCRYLPKEEEKKKNWRHYLQVVEEEEN
ncbi:hypothetical protein NL676_030251 [Syzygium grande]|nr:hypothetical protein NL676_030251 [Syzygium grande]